MKDWCVLSSREWSVGGGRKGTKKEGDYVEGG